MNTTTTTKTAGEKKDRPRYETPRLVAMTEKEILTSFQITQSMGSWWNVASC
jgi:hypothetical protein